MICGREPTSNIIVKLNPKQEMHQVARTLEKKEEAAMVGEKMSRCKEDHQVVKLKPEVKLIQSLKVQSHRVDWKHFGNEMPDQKAEV